MEQKAQAGRDRHSLSRRQSASTDTNKTIPILNPAFFTPLQTFPPLATTIPTTTPQTKEENLQKLIANLLAQHETVKQNLITVATSRAKEIRKSAQAEIDSLPPSQAANGNSLRNAQEDEIFKKGIEETMRNMRSHPKAGAKSEDFELKPTPPASLQSLPALSTTQTPGPGQEQGQRKSVTFREGGKVIKSTSPLPERTAQTIRAETAKKIRDLIDSSVEEIETYEKMSEKHVDFYRDLLERERSLIRNPGLAKGGFAGVGATGDRKMSSATASPIERPRGILTNHAPTPVDVRALRKMSQADILEANGGNGGAGAGKSKSKEELRKEEEARMLAAMGERAAKASSAREAREKAERDAMDAQLQEEMLSMQNDLLANMTPEEAATMRAWRG